MNKGRLIAVRALFRNKIVSVFTSRIFVFRQRRPWAKNRSKERWSLSAVHLLALFVLASCASNKSATPIAVTANQYDRIHIITRHGEVDKSTCSDPGHNCKLNGTGNKYASKVINIVNSAVTLTGIAPTFYAFERTQDVATIKPSATEHNAKVHERSADHLVRKLWDDLDNQTNMTGIWAMSKNGLSGYAQLFQQIRTDSDFFVSSTCPTDFFESGVAYTWYLMITPGTKHTWNVQCTRTHQKALGTACSASSCSAIAGTSCGWCVTSNGAFEGSATGQDPGACNNWIWDSDDCDCASISSCSGIDDTSYGWCATMNQAMVGDSSGPPDGVACLNWIWRSDDCNCAGMTSCSSISGTSCGWCEDYDQAMPGSESGPEVGSCKKWTWSSGDCPSMSGGR